ncbi:phospholipid carrier-dependent glycosyltransferase, partial [Patescibacteria group bacterium]|nr:phospholipid carrier-dependent glycosyltransferase [Patescibacteria group bacterium]
MAQRRIVMIVIITTVILAVFIPRIFNLDAFRTADEKRWLANTSGFITSLAHGKFDRLLQQPHPGITTQWFGATTIRYSDFATKKIPLVIAQGLLILAIGYLFYRLWGRTAGLLVALMLAFDPLLYAHTRIYAMDSLLSLFLVLSIGALLVWRKTTATRYLVIAGLTAAAAILSKLPGIIIVPFTLLLFLYWAMYPKLKQGKKQTGNWPLEIGNLSTWLLAGIVGLVLILPSLALDPVGVWGDITELFRSDEYLAAHAGSPLYYVRTLAFFSSPIHLLLIVSVPLAWFALKRNPGKSRISKEQLVILLIFAALFITQMTLGLKKGDRYILPSFVALDVIAAATITALLSFKSSPDRWLRITGYGLLAVLAWQATIIWQSHPYTLAYVNPITRPWFAERRPGWGQGLD